MVVVLAAAVPASLAEALEAADFEAAGSAEATVVMAATATVDIAITAITAIAAATPDIMVDTTNLPTHSYPELHPKHKEGGLLDRLFRDDPFFTAIGDPHRDHQCHHDLNFSNQAVAEIL